MGTVEYKRAYVSSEGLSQDGLPGFEREDNCFKRAPEWCQTTPTESVI
jgi:hypothetical protein